jgi:dihydrofolate synthase/folylpolyglutamate synthase
VRSLDDWLAWISAQHPSTIALGLDRVREVAARMAPSPLGEGGGEGNFQRPVALTVGGTNGKGSTCAFLETILLEAGYRVGTYTSPHILRYNERVRIQGEDATDALLVESFERVEAARGATPLTYFEFGTLAALWIFQASKLDAWVLEVGLGGRLDAVNVIDADCAIVVSVDLDHQAFLGNDRESIGFEKAGIFRAGRPAIFGDTNPPARLVEHARAIGADLQVLGRDFRVEASERQWDFVGRRSTRRALPIPALRGAWQLKNAASALAALDEVAERLPLSVGEVKRGLSTVRLAGRLQSLPGRPAIVLDVAHNPHAARSLAQALGDMGFFESTFAVFAMLADKDIGGVVDAVRHRIDRWYVSAAQADRAASAEAVAGVLAGRGIEAVRTFATVDAALQAARRDAGSNDRIVVFGSFHTVAEALRSAR